MLSLRLFSLLTAVLAASHLDGFELTLDAAKRTVTVVPATSPASFTPPR